MRPTSSSSLPTILAGGDRAALLGRALRQCRRLARQRCAAVPAAARGRDKLPITDPRMTRFWITLDQGAAFVERCLGLMHGGEMFVPKIPSMRITDLAAVMAPECRQEIVGIRPGEKLHECLIPHDEARLTREFDDFYVILPARPASATFDPIYEGSKGRPVAENFEYTSDANDRWSDRAQLREMIG